MTDSLPVASELILSEESGRAIGCQIGDIIETLGHKYVVKEMGRTVRCVLIPEPSQSGSAKYAPIVDELNAKQAAKVQ